MEKRALSFVFVASVLSFNPQLMKKIGACATVSDGKAQTVYLVKQWHLPPSITAKLKRIEPFPQEKNQTQIYGQLAEWIKASSLDTAIAEGCEGEIDDNFKPAFQGWSYADLKQHAHDPDFNKILSHVVVKLKARYPSELHAACGDKLSEIKNAELALSDARADVGYLSRIEEHKNDPVKLKPYLDGAIEAYHLKAGTTVRDAEDSLVIDLRKSLKSFEDSTHERDLSFVQKITAIHSAKPTVLVVGGLHATDLKTILESQKMNCEILEPLAYQNDEEALNQKLKALIR